MQFNGGNRWGRLNPSPGINATAIGIGTFTSPNQPAAALHINTIGLGNPFYGAGDVFRTDAPVGTALNPIDINWRIFRGTTQVVRFFNPYSSFVPSTSGQKNDLVIETILNRSNIILRTAGISRMIIQDGTGVSNPTGLVGVGNNFLEPTSQFHLNDGIFDTYMQITNNFSGATAGDGFRFGVLSTGEVLLNQQEAMPMWFRVNNNNAIEIAPTGIVTINFLASETETIVMANQNGTLKTIDAETLLMQSKTIAQLQNKITELENKLNNLTAKNEIK